MGEDGAGAGGEDEIVVVVVEEEEVVPLNQLTRSVSDETRDLEDESEVSYDDVDVIFVVVVS